MDENGVPLPALICALEKHGFSLRTISVALGERISVRTLARWRRGGDPQREGDALALRQLYSQISQGATA